MDIINKVTKTVSDLADKTASGVNKLADKAKIEYKINDTKSKLDKNYISLGQLKFSEMNGATVTDDMYEGIAAQIRDCETKLCKLNADLHKLNNCVNCPNCGHTVKKGSRFCPDCGSKIG